MRINAEFQVLTGRLQDAVRELGSDVEVRPKVGYLAFLAGQRFAIVRQHRNYLLVNIKLRKASGVRGAFKTEYRASYLADGWTHYAELSVRDDPLSLSAGLQDAYLEIRAQT